MTAANPTSFTAPVPANLSKGVVDEIAGRVAAKVGYKPGGDLDLVVRTLGGVIHYQSWGMGDKEGSLTVNPGQAPLFTIRVANFAGNLRNRFTIAHELGHYFLHSDIGKKAIQAARAGSGRVEWEANWFAGAFLLPKDQFLKDWEAYGHSVPRMVGVYQVSEAVVQIRLETLGLR
jgi:hypothetical protein